MIEYTRLRLTQWGRWCRGRPQTGYPSMSPFMRANEGSRATGNDLALPDDILEVEQSVNKLSSPHRMALIGYYVMTGPLWLRAARLRISRRTMMRRVTTAERQINLRLCDAPET
jgi:DNA-directed RNA polymerase specialized sigma24 family protein